MHAIDKPEKKINSCENILNKKPKKICAFF